MRKIIPALIAIVPWAAAPAQEPHAPVPLHQGGRSTDENRPAKGRFPDTYGAGPKAQREAALTAFQAAYAAAAAMRTDQAMRLFLLSLYREPMPKTLYDLAIVCSRDSRWDDALSFQHEAQNQSADPEVARLAALEIERLQTIANLEGSPDGKKLHAFDMRFLPVLKARSQRAALDELKSIVKQDNTHWEAFAQEGILYAELKDFPESLAAFEQASLMAPPDRAEHLKEAADLARREAAFNEKRISADELWEKQQYKEAAEDYKAAWESSPAQVEMGLKAATGFLMADHVELAVPILSSMRSSATGDMGVKIAAMLKELAAVSDEAKRASQTTGGSNAPLVVETSAHMRTLVGSLTSRQMELAARADPPLLDDKTRIISVPDDEISGGQSNSPLLSTESVYAIYKRDSAPAAATEPAASPGSSVAPAQPGLSPSAAAKPSPMPNLTEGSLPARTEPARPMAVGGHVPGEVRITVSSDPPQALVKFDKDDRITCTAPCLVSLSAGRHTWSASLHGYRDALGIFKVEKGKSPPSVMASLEAKRGFVTVKSGVAGLAIFLNGEMTESRTPAGLKLMEGTYQVGVEVDGRLVTQQIEVRDGALETIIF